MTDNPLFEETLSHLLLQARRGVDRAAARAAEAGDPARQEVARSEPHTAREEPPRQGSPAEEIEPEAPPVPAMSELMRPSPGVTRFLDGLLGPSQA